MYFWKKDNIYYVSKIRIYYKPDTERLDIDAEDVNVSLLKDALARETGTTILADPLPQERITLHLKDTTIKDLIAILIKRFPDYKLESEKNFYYMLNKNKKYWYY